MILIFSVSTEKYLKYLTIRTAATPEEFDLGAVLDEITNVYTLGATAFALFAEYKRDSKSWTLSDDLYKVALKATSNNRSERQQTIQEFIYEWNKYNI